MPQTTPTTPTTITSHHRLLLGALLLFCVDLIWVLSSELSDHIYHDEHYDKPFFTVFVKTGFFIIFLLGRVGNGGEGGGGAGYRLITEVEDESSQQPHPPTVTATPTDTDTETDTESIPPTSTTTTTLSPPAFVPVNYNTDDANSNSDGDGNNRVKFSRVAEVRVCSPKDATEATLSRMSYSASLQAASQLQGCNKLTHLQTARLALTFCGMWFLANYTYALSLSTSSHSVALINVLSSTSSLFTLFLSAVFPSVPTDRLTISKLVCVLVSICGVVVVSLEKTEGVSGGGGGGIGALWALVSAGFYAGYLVFLRRAVGGDEQRLDVFLFFGLVGLFNVLLLWPLFLIFHYSGLEPFLLPNHRQWLFLIVNGLVGTVFSEVLWVWSCLLTSSLIATLAISLTIPMAMVADVFFKSASYSLWFYMGSIPVLLGFVGVTVLGGWGGDWDPVGDLCSSIGGGVGNISRVDIAGEEPLLDDDNTEIN